MKITEKILSGAAASDRFREVLRRCEHLRRRDIVVRTEEFFVSIETMSLALEPDSGDVKTLTVTLDRQPPYRFISRVMRVTREGIDTGICRCEMRKGDNPSDPIAVEVPAFATVKCSPWWD